MIELNENTHCLGIWFLDVPSEGFNVLATVTKQPGESYKGLVRFRYKRDDKAFDSADEKSGYIIDSESEERSAGMEVRRAIVKGLRAIHAKAGGSYNFLPLDCSGSEAAERLMAQPWAHMKWMPKEGADG